MDLTDLILIGSNLIPYYFLSSYFKLIILFIEDTHHAWQLVTQIVYVEIQPTK